MDWKRRTALACAIFVGLAILAIPFWLLSGFMINEEIRYLPNDIGIILLGTLAALAGAGLVITLVGWRDDPGRPVGLAVVNGFLLAFAMWILWAWGTYLAEPPCPKC